MSLMISGKEPVLWSNETGDIRAIKIAFEDGEEKEVYKENKCMCAMELDIAHAKITGGNPLWITVEYFTDEQTAIQQVQKQSKVIMEMTSAFINMNLKKSDKESDQNLN